MSAQPSSSRAVTIGYRLVTVMLVVAAVFGVVAVVSVGVGVARHGDSLLYGHRLVVALELSPDKAATIRRMRRGGSRAQSAIGPRTASVRSRHARPAALHRLR